ncbi:uncharacterized protein G2W53_005197 [Senna tora]|uniref:Uncharacterized protein n=1 Tax=Senna tora TaxID=362788 RepID=A0A834XEG8_9FABA|nr:uncharacterized protein G2W53_005197 [Senna tora]
MGQRVGILPKTPGRLPKTSK